MTQTAQPSAPIALPPAHDLPLLRLRMRLALLTMAILPTALALALAHSSLSAQTLTDRLLLQDQTVTAARLLESQLERTVGSVILLAADPAIAVASTDPTAAAAHTRTLFGLSGAAFRRASMFDPSGSEQLVLHPPGSDRSDERSRADVRSAIAAGRDSAIVTSISDGAGSDLLIWAPVVDAGGAAQGVLRVEISIDGIVRGVQAGVGSGTRLMVIDHTAGSIVDSTVVSTTADNEPGPGDVLASIASNPTGTGQWTIADDWTVSALPLSDRFAGWRVVLIDRVAAPQLPLLLLALMGTLSLLLVGITVWMTHQVMRPAEDLANSREQLLQLYEAARNDALRDGLTGLGNHRAFQEELDRQLEWLRRYQVPFALVLLDVDDLKLVNDTDGHAAGDQLVRQMGTLIERTRRYADRAFRIGGDEFALLLPHTSAAEALEFGRRLLDLAGRLPDRPIKFSGGISACPALATTRDQLFAQADAALYWCKRHGRGSLDVFDPLRDRQVEDQSAGRAGQLAQVIGRGMLRAVYQPVVDLQTGAVIAFEGLIRPSPESGFRDPGELFAAAEAAGRTVELDQACLATVLAQATGLAPEQMLSINLSPRTVEAPQFSVEWIVGQALANQLAPDRLIIELTEHEMIEDLPRLQRNLAALQKAGIRIAIDDLGAGNAGLRLLSQFRFDIVKVDLSLIQDGTRRDSSRAVLSSLRELAGRWGAYVVAEGLETVSQLRAVREIGLSAGQGFLLGRPAATPSLRRVDLTSIGAGGVVLEVRHPQPADVSIGVPRTGTA